MTDAEKPKYQCDHSPDANTMHHCTIICEGCLRKIVNQRIKLLEVMKCFSHDEFGEKYQGEVSLIAKELLKEIGEV